MTKTRQRIAVIGASGYTGVEVIRLLLGHPHVEIAVLTGDSQAGKRMAEVYPHLAFAGLPPLLKLEETDFSAIDAAFCCLPHGTAQEVVAALPAHLRIIDLSADFRLRDVETYARWYGHAHRAPALQGKAVYGLTECYRDAIREARLVACPGCYPTSALLPLLPLLEAGCIAEEGIIIDAKSGVSGAGRSVKQGNLFCEVNEGVSAYSVGGHRHCPEIEQELSRVIGKPATITFTPHLAPMSRGMLTTIYASLKPGITAENARAALEARYLNEPFVHVLPPGLAPATQQVRGTNHCFIGVFADRVPGRVILVSTIDNLVKGASGQAVQNLNAMMGWPEETGLMQTAVFP